MTSPLPMASPLIDEQILAEATFQMLASSTMRRYLTFARKSAEAANLGELLRTRDGYSLAVARGGELLSTVSHAQGREPAEFELAVLLVALVDNHAEDAGQLCRRVQDLQNPATKWLSVLASHLVLFSAPSNAQLNKLWEELDSLVTQIEPPEVQDDPQLQRAA